MDINIFLETQTSKLKLKKFQEQRWIGLHDSINRILKNFDVLVNIYLGENMPFPFYGEKELLEQYLKLFGYLSLVSKTAQSKKPDPCTVFRLILQLRERLLIEDDKEYGDVRRARIELLHGLDSRFFSRYESAEKNNSMSLELAMLFNPFYKNLHPLETALQNYFSSNRKKNIDRCKKNVYEAAERLYEKIASKEDIVENDVEDLVRNCSLHDVETGPARKVKVKGVSRPEFEFQSFQAELKSYLSENLEYSAVDENAEQGIHVMEADEVCDYWRVSQYPRLKKLAQIVVRIYPGSGPLENDFTMSGKALSKHRASLGSDFFDMTLTLHRNFSLFDTPAFLNSIEQLQWSAAQDARPRNTYTQCQSGNEEDENDENVTEADDSDVDGIFDQLISFISSYYEE